ncbi:MAG: class I SAM-dependent methyltransferase [Paludibacteraceae bacterium]|nr:class I SAM-dependent methyltransferase [Prevotellaceae bacterium]
MDTTSKLLEEYILRHIDEEPAILKQLTRDTNLYTLKPRMLSGHLQGRMLKMFCNMVSPTNILEIGTFTGYSALCMAESLKEGGMLHTIEVNDEMEEFLARVFSESGYADRIQLHIGDAIKIIPEIDAFFDVAFIDGNKRHYVEYFDVVYPKMKVGGVMIADNTLWDAHVLEEDSKDAQTLGIKRFNDMVATDERVEKVIVPVRDGMTLIRKIR